MNKEIEKMLIEVGRNPVEIRVGDIYITKNSSAWYIYDEEFLRFFAKEDFAEDKVTGIVPFELIKWVK